MSPLISIITVTKNCCQTIEATLSSVSQIKTRLVQYIVIDGVSVDGTIEIIQKHSSVIDIFISEPDKGIYNAMNKGVKYATGKYVLFLNGDDQILVPGFKDLLETMQDQNADIVCGVTIVGSTEAPSEVLIPKPWRLPFYNSIPHPSTFALRNLMNSSPFREDLAICADYDFFLRSFLSRKSFKVFNTPIALHFRGGASGDSTKSNAEILKVKSHRLGLLLPVLQHIMRANRIAKKLLGRRT